MSASKQAVGAASRGCVAKRSHALADVGLTWYTALETAAEIGVSDSTLARIADALLLDSAERDYVFKLARGIPGKTESAVSLRIREAVDAIRAPAYVIADDWTILYWNAAFCHRMESGAARVRRGS